MNQGIPERMSYVAAFALLLSLPACESPIGPHADQETWVFELTHVYLEEEESGV